MIMKNSFIVKWKRREKFHSNIQSEKLIYPITIPVNSLFAPDD